MDMAWELKSTSLPNDIALTIVSFLDEACDVCSLGGCSKFWYQMCSSDCLWFYLCNKRWPKSQFHFNSNSNSNSHQEGWKIFYISMHTRLSASASTVIKFVEGCTDNGSLEVGNYLKAVDHLLSMDLGFKDVQLLLLTERHNALLNLIGLHYSIFYLGISIDELMKALHASQVAERQVCVSWFKLGRWFYGSRLPDTNRSRKVSLGDLAAMADEGAAEVLGVLNRGVVHEVLRVQIISTNIWREQPSLLMGSVS